MTKLIIAFKEDNIQGWGTPEGETWDSVQEDLDGDCTAGEVKNYILSEIFPKFDLRLFEIIEFITKDPDLYQNGNTIMDCNSRIYCYEYELDNNISEELIDKLINCIENELTDVDSMYIVSI